MDRGSIRHALFQGRYDPMDAVAEKELPLVSLTGEMHSRSVDSRTTAHRTIAGEVFFADS
jgi:hypothetical protein